MDRPAVTAGLAPPPARVFVVEERDNPSTAYYLLPALTPLGCPVIRRGFADPPDTAQLDGALVVFVRYLPRPWRRLAAAGRSRLSGLVFFMDDDLFDTAASRGAPPHYRFKLWRLAGRHRDWLAAHGAQVWVSTPYLLDKYADLAPRLVPPAPLPEDGPAREIPPRTALEPGTALRRVFSHATASHNPDIRWLAPVMARVLADHPRISFEAAGTGSVARALAALPRTTVVAPMPWPAYRVFAAAPGRHVGLAPQLPSAFNAARSHTKFFDITRSGAVGIYAAGSACASVVDHGRDGLVLPMDPDAWAEAIPRLALDDAGRAAMLDNAREKAAELGRQAATARAHLFSPREDADV